MSQNYNPHSLDREWGFILAGLRPALTLQNTDLRTARRAIAQEIQLLLPESAACLPKQVGKVSTDTIGNDLASLRQQVGSDILCLTLLADVPLDRPLHISQSNLIGHWRWLRQVWAYLDDSKISDASEAESIKVHVNPRNDVIDEIAKGRFNTAIAALRCEFKALRTSQNRSYSHDLRLSFIADLTLFCPLIGSALLYRSGYKPHATNHHAKDSEE